MQAKETENETPQLLRNVARQLLQHADSMEQTSNTSGRMGADSLRKDQIFKQAASNRSLKRAEDFQMFQDRSHTLDASDGVRNLYVCVHVYAVWCTDPLVNTRYAWPLDHSKDIWMYACG